MAKDISRRNFLKALGGGAVASSALLAACTDGKQGAAKGVSPAISPRVSPSAGGGGAAGLRFVYPIII